MNRRTYEKTVLMPAERVLARTLAALTEQLLDKLPPHERLKRRAAFLRALKRK